MKLPCERDTLQRSLCGSQEVFFHSSPFLTEGESWLWATLDNRPLDG